MDTEAITNQNLMSTDFARKERIAFLENIPPDRQPGESNVAPDLPDNAVRRGNISAMDRCSLKAKSTGRRGYQALWRGFNCALRRLHAASIDLVVFVLRHHRPRRANDQLPTSQEI
jgi:hypothetical protein